ncbi:MAG TPA: hypothetical protein VKC53_00940 [Patescibacteria group bacterium]|nr:hypothetical protein [Patescibacteria group bacterium]
MSIESFLRENIEGQSISWKNGATRFVISVVNKLENKPIIDVTPSLITQRTQERITHRRIIEERRERHERNEVRRRRAQVLEKHDTP